MSEVFEVQPRAHRSDGTESGRLRTELVSGALVPLLLKPYEVQVSAGVSSIVQYQPLLTSLGISGLAGGMHWRMTTSAVATLQAFATLDFTFMGDTFGLIFNPGYGNSATIPPAPLGLMIDNVAFDLPREPKVIPESLILQTRPSGYIYRVFRHLGRGEHQAKVVLSGSATIQRDASVVCGLVEAAAGYQPPPRGIVRQGAAATAIATSGTIIDPQSFTAPPIIALRDIVLTNSTSPAITVTPIANTSFAAPIAAPVSVPANGTAVLSFPDPIYQPITLVASATGVTAAVGGFI